LRAYGIEPWALGQYTRRELELIVRDYREMEARGQEQP
jgi:hypothetical protein